MACAVLHNIAFDMNEDLFPGEEHSIEQSSHTEQGYGPRPSVKGHIRRRQFIEAHF